MKHYIAAIIFILSPLSNAVAQTPEELLKAQCAIEFNLSQMRPDEVQTMPVTIDKLRPPSTTFRRVNKHIFRIEGRGLDCGNYAASFLGDPISFDGLQLKKIVTLSSSSSAPVPHQ